MTTFLQRLTKDDRGGALAEFALGLIPLILAFALIFEVGRAFWIHQAAIKGVRDATRYLTRVALVVDAEGTARFPANALEVAENLMLTGQQTGGVARWDSGARPAMIPPEPELEPVANLRCSPNCLMVTVGTNVEIQLPLAGVFTLFGGASPAFTFSLSDTGRHYGT